MKPYLSAIAASLLMTAPAMGQELKTETYKMGDDTCVVSSYRKTTPTVSCTKGNETSSGTMDTLTQKSYKLENGKFDVYHFRPTAEDCRNVDLLTGGWTPCLISGVDAPEQKEYRSLVNRVVQPKNRVKQ